MSKDLENFNELTEILGSLPGIGKKNALRLAFFLSTQDKFTGARLAHMIEKCIGIIGFCTMCGGISEHEICDICSDDLRDCKKLCIVESPKDIFLLESIKAFEGRYFVFNDRELSMLKLQEFCDENDLSEILFAFPPSIASEGLIMYIEDKLSGKNITFTKIAQGVPGGVSLENVDTISLFRAIDKRVKA